MPRIGGSSLDIADEQAQRTRQAQLSVALAILAEQEPHRVPADRLVAVHQHRHEQRRLALTGEMDQRRPRQPRAEIDAVELKQPVGELVEFMQGE